MKLSKVAAVVTALLAHDAKPTEAQIIAAVVAADKKGKDEGGLGPVEIENKGKDGKGKDEFPDKKDDKKDAKDRKGKDEKDDPEGTNAKDGKDDEDKDGAKDGEMDVEGNDDVQPKKSANGNAGAGGAEPSKDSKGMDAKGVAAAIAANDAKHAAAREVEPILGVVTLDSAGAYYKAALDKLGVDTKDVHESAFPALLKLAKDKANAAAAPLATDAARVSGMAGAIKGYDRLK